MCSAATTDTTPAATLPGAAELAPADLPPAAPSPAAPPPAEAVVGTAGPGASAEPTSPRIVVIGLGNPLLGDDGVGWRVVDLVEARLGGAWVGERSGPQRRFDVERLAVGGLSLMERLVGYERAILVDAVASGDDPPGTVRVAPLAEVVTRTASHLDSSHDAPLTTAIAAGRSLGAELPASVTVVTIEAERIDTFDESLSPAVAASVWSAADAVLAVAATGRPDR